MAELIYTLCALTSVTCAWLLWRAYAQHKHRLLFWSALCFAGLTGNNLLLILDKVMLPGIDLSTWRLVVALFAPLLLLYGLISEDE